MFRKILLSSALAAVSSVSLAADLPRRAPAPAPAPYSPAPVSAWTGFYAGAQLGVAWDKDDVSATNAAGALVGFGNLNTSAVVGGIHAGYNHQLPGSAVVIGVEGDFEGSGINKTSNVFYSAAGALLPGAYTLNTKIDWQGSLRARVGYAFGDALLYATGGVAFADIKTNYASAGTAAGYSGVHAGWTAGAGLEYAISRNWTVRGEYRYASYGNVNDGLIPAPVAFWGGVSESHKIAEHALRAGVSYRF